MRKTRKFAKLFVEKENETLCTLCCKRGMIAITRTFEETLSFSIIPFSCSIQ